MTNIVDFDFLLGSWNVRMSLATVLSLLFKPFVVVSR